MKYQPILYSLPVFLPLDALAHPGHDAGAGTTGEFLAVLALASVGLLAVAIRAFRRRKSARADD